VQKVCQNTTITKGVAFKTAHLALFDSTLLSSSLLNAEPTLGHYRTESVNPTV